MTALNNLGFDPVALGLQSAPQQSGPDNDNLGQEDFLTLMTTQLMNQDPFAPMENGEFLGQMAQFSTVSGLEQLNTAFAGLAGSLTSGQALQAAAVVGRNVTIESNIGHLNTGEAMTGAISLSQASSEVVLEITDTNGQLVRELNLGAQGSGDVPFSWDGLNEVGNPLPPGNYVIQARAQIGDRTTALPTQINARVESVNLGQGGQGLSVQLEGLGAAPFSQIRQIL